MRKVFVPAAVTVVRGGGRVLDPRREAVLIADKEGRPEDKTSQISRYEVQPATGRVVITFSSGKSYPYGMGRVRILRDPERSGIDESSRVEISGEIWGSVRELLIFAVPGAGAWARVFYRQKDGEAYRSFPASEVRVLASATGRARAATVLDYFRAVVGSLPTDDPLVRSYDQLTFVHPESALAAYLSGSEIGSQESGVAPIFPFRCNLSQRTAVENALTRSVSVIEGPPGTGKTETILNLVANVIGVQHRTIGVVSHTNSAVDNVREKLEELGFGHVVANLGRKDKRASFFAAQADRNAQVGAFVARTPQPVSPERLAHVDRRLRQLQDIERRRAETRESVAAYRLERQHFEQHVRRAEVAELADLPLLRRSADRILDYLAESELDGNGARPGLLSRIRRYFRYGSLRGLDSADTGVVLRLQRAYYERRISELDAELEGLERRLEVGEFDRLAREHHELSAQLLHVDLGTRYQGLPRKTYQQETYRGGREFATFVEDYPVILSTCHSLRPSLAQGYLLDYLVIDEASQVDPLVAALALSCCRNLVIVGDMQQLPPVLGESAPVTVPPSPVYDRGEQSIMSSLLALYEDALPRTLLREHYRCDPAIIGFCNKKFYGGDLIPYRTRGVERAMIVARTVEGNHMRRLHGRTGVNQREVDVVAAEVIPKYCAGIADSDVGVTTPYRLQANRLGDELDQIAADTVHRFQGRQKKVVVMTTVLDETREGRMGLRFVDNPQLINVAVSRAVERFVLVTNHDMLPRSRHIRDLIGYIRYHDAHGEVMESSIVSIFDLLYQKYSVRLIELARRRKHALRFPSEDIALTVLRDILADERYMHLTVVHQVLLMLLFRDVGALTERQARFVKNRASVDFVVYNRVTNEPLLAIEVDGFAYHANRPDQLARDAIKDEIFRARRFPLLRLPTTGSEEEAKIRRALDDALDVQAARPVG